MGRPRRSPRLRAAAPSLAPWDPGRGLPAAGSPGAGDPAAPALTSLIAAAGRGARGAARAGEARGPRGCAGDGRGWPGSGGRAPAEEQSLARGAAAPEPAPRLWATSFPPRVPWRPRPVGAALRAASGPAFYTRLRTRLQRDQWQRLLPQSDGRSHPMAAGPEVCCISKLG